MAQFGQCDDFDVDAEPHQLAAGVLGVLGQDQGLDPPVVADGGRDGVHCPHRLLVQDDLPPVLRKTGVAPLAVLVTETAHNTFARLPVCTGESVAVSIRPASTRVYIACTLPRCRLIPLTREILSGIGRERAEAPEG
ncbi:hypothetical protein [Streptomyces sp. SAJ15]|uniref:hypothetical protein n=1 Tax=Streptomyces sp. SAJ15 TaxID=2011095 RepID=UPI0037DA5E87